MTDLQHGGPAAGAAGRDPLFDALDPLVRAGTLRPDQATAVLHAVTPVLAGTGAWSLRERTSAALAVLGAAMALGGVAVSVAAQSGFEWKLFLASVAGIAVIAGAAVAVRVLLPSSAAVDWIGGVLTALAVLATGGLILRLGEDTAGTDYAAGVLMIVLGCLGYLVLRHSALTLPVIAGLLTLVMAVLLDVVDADPQPGDGTVLMIGLALAGVGVVVAVGGWFLPSRNVTAMIGGAIAVLSMLGTIYFLALFLQLSGIGGGPRRLAGVSDDIWTAMAVGLLACVGLASLHAATQYAGYAALAVLGVTALPVAAVAAAGSDHPARWSVALAATAAFVVVGSMAPTLLARRQLATGRWQPPAGH